MDSTLAAVNKAVEENHKDEPRYYLGFSEIGSRCKRKLYYSYNNYPRKPMSAKSIRAIEDGHRGEELMVQRLALAGITVTDRQREFTLLDGKFMGHWDGCIVPLCSQGGEAYVWEHKSTSVSLTSIAKKGLEDWSSEYYAQAQMYMHCSDLKKHYLTVSSPGERDSIALVTDYDELYAKGLIDHAEAITCADRTPPPFTNKQETFYYCKYFCSYSEQCLKDV